MPTGIFLLFFGLKTIKKIQPANATAIRVCCKWIHPQQRRQKSDYKSTSLLFKTRSLLFHLVQFRKCQRMFLELSSKSLYLTLEKEKKRKLLSSVHVLLKRDIKKFHFVVVQRWQRNVQKSVMHVQSCCFAVLCFWRSSCRRRCWSSQMAPTVTPVLTSHANVLRYSFLVGGYPNFSS